MLFVLMIGLPAVAVAVVVALLVMRQVRGPRSELPPEFMARQDALRRRLVEIIARVPLRPPLSSGEVPDHPRAASIEAKLLAGNTAAALMEAEALLAAAPDDGRVRVLLARVLIHCNQLPAASYELTRARWLGAGGPMLDYLEGRAKHLQLQKRTSPAHRARAWAAELITPFELFILQLEKQRRRSRKDVSAWIASASKAAGAGITTISNTRNADSSTDVSIDHNDIVALVAEHFSAYYDCLEKFVAAVETVPGFSDALYHTARLALKAGFTDEGTALMTKIAPLMDASPEKSAYTRDLSQLRGRGADFMSSRAAPVPGPDAEPSARRDMLN